jgi:hypothetical protein
VTEAPTLALPPTLERNLRALANVDRDLVRRLLWPAGSDHVVRRPEGGPLYRLHTKLHPLAVPEAECEAGISPVTDGEEVFLFGLGTGEIAQKLCELRPSSHVVAWDRDPWLVRLALAEHDFARAIRERRIRFSLGVDLVEEIERATAWRVLPHPLLSAVYAHEKRLLDTGRTQTRRAALALGGLLVDDLAPCLADEGFEVLPFDLERWSIEELTYAIERYDPEVLVSVNYRKGLAEFCEARGVELVVWEIDPSTERAPSLRTGAPRVHMCTWRRAHVRSWREAGFSDVRYLPLASDPRRRRPLDLSPDERERYAAPVCFVGASMVEEASRHRRRFVELHASWHPDGSGSRRECDARLQELLDSQREDYTSDRMPELVEQEFGEFLAAIRRGGLHEDPLLLASEVAAAEKRLAYVAELGRFGIHVWGDDSWRAVEAFGARYRGPAGHHEELTKIYNAAAIHVDVGRLYQQDAVPLRVFDVLACGGFLIAEHSEALAECFQIGVELESYRTQQELEEKIAYYQAHADEARLIAELGLAAVRERHTLHERVREMLALVRGA